MRSTGDTGPGVAGPSANEYGGWATMLRPPSPPQTSCDAGPSYARFSARSPWLRTAPRIRQENDEAIEREWNGRNNMVTLTVDQPGQREQEADHARAGDREPEIRRTRLGRAHCRRGRIDKPTRIPGLYEDSVKPRLGLHQNHPSDLRGKLREAAVGNDRCPQQPDA